MDVVHQNDGAGVGASHGARADDVAITIGPVAGVDRPQN